MGPSYRHTVTIRLPHTHTHWCHMSVTLFMASASKKITWSDSDTATEGDDGLTSHTVIDKTDTTICLLIPSLLDKLRAPSKSELARKCPMTFNPPCDGKSCKRPICVSDSKSITPETHVNNYLHKCFVVSAGKLFCTACREELSVKTSALKLHMKSMNHNQVKMHFQHNYFTFAVSWQLSGNNS